MENRSSTGGLRSKSRQLSCRAWGSSVSKAATSCLEMQDPSEGLFGQKSTLVANSDDSANFQSGTVLLKEDKVERSDCETATASGFVSVISAEDHLSGGIRNFNEDRRGVSTKRVVPR